MTYEEALYHAKSGKALLFYGSGMAYDVLNMRDEKMPTGAALSHILCKESGFKEEEYHDDLEHSSQEYIEIKGDISLIKLLKEVFKTKKLPNYYAEISKTPWKSIFTTNYDNSLEISSINNGIHRNSIDLTFDPKNFLLAPKILFILMDILSLLIKITYIHLSNLQNRVILLINL